MKAIIFTDLDGTLLNSEDYDYDHALPVLGQLRENQIPVVPVTSKTRPEVEKLREALTLADPFIVENGSGIFVPLDSPSWIIPNPHPYGNYHQESLGCTYLEAREGLKTLSTLLGETLEGFGDLEERDIQALTGLSLEDVELGQAREFSEPFLTPKSVDTEILAKMAQNCGWRIVIGDRFSHLISSHAGKGKAVKWLIEKYQEKNQLITIGLGNSPNDLEMLETVDIPIIIPGGKGVHPGLEGRGWKVAPDIGSQGWAKVVKETLKDLKIS